MSSKKLSKLLMIKLKLLFFVLKSLEMFQENI